VTVLVKKKNPPRYACKRCKCEVGSGPNPEKRLCDPDAALDRHLVAEDDPIAFDRDCECRCHIIWRIMFGHFTPKLQAQAATWNARVIEPPPPRSAIEDLW
jgi:hypothetical protein